MKFLRQLIIFKIPQTRDWGSPSSALFLQQEVLYSYNQYRLSINLLRCRMKRISLFSLLFIIIVSSVLYPQLSSRKGWWKFDDANNLLKAEPNTGTDLLLVGKHEIIDGPTIENGAAKLGPGNHYKMLHGISPNGGGARVNEYTIQIDFRIPVLSGWHCFFQTDPTNGTDGDCFVNASGNIGVYVTGYSSHSIVANEWYRFVLSIKNGTQHKYYLDGQLFHDGTPQAVDGRFALEDLLLVFADEDGEDGEIDCAELAIWDRALSPEEIFSLGSFHEIDVTPPNPLTAMTVTSLLYQNLITWDDVSGETGETYDIYCSENPITDITKAKALKLGVAENTQSADQVLRSPNTDQDLTYYYAIVCKDYSGNYSQPFFYNTPITNKGKGVPTIAKAAPVNFKADGDLSEWAGVPQIRILTSEGTGFEVDIKPIAGDGDLSVLAYIAVDKDNLYFAADVTDDIYAWYSTVASYQNDCVDLFLGLFDAHNITRPFAYYQRGATPHYHFRFDEKQVLIEGGAEADSLLLNDGTQDYFFGQKSLTPGYLIEAKLPFSVLANKRDSGTLDSLFVPAEGMEIPIDFSINDNDGNPNDDGGREGILCYSPLNNDNAYQHPWRWLWTWIGNKMVVDDVNDENMVNGFSLAQNYPNPFNPSTKISYALQNPELVSLKVFDVLGREVATLVNQYQSVGNHTVNFNAVSLSSGIYFYKLEAGSFKSIKKLVLLK